MDSIILQYSLQATQHLLIHHQETGTPLFLLVERSMALHHWVNGLQDKMLISNTLKGRETFLTTVKWVDGWPILNNNLPILLSESFGKTPDQKYPPAPFVDDFSSSTLDKSWYQLRTPYTETYRLPRSKRDSNGVIFTPNVFSLSERDVPATILRKQKSLNMTFSATLLPTTDSLGPLQSVGISTYLSEFQHQDVGIRGCTNETGLCFYSTLLRNVTATVSDHPHLSSVC